jgi:tRNA-2-methylthio-N6-dimethylallyladenosine synthase
MDLPETFYVRTFGCQMNEHDSERISGLLASVGLREVSRAEEAGLLVYNTCSIREKADTRLLGHLGEARRLKKEDPRRLVVVAGCLAQSRQNAFFVEHPYVDVLVGPQSLHELPLLLDERLATGGQTAAFQEATTRWSADLPAVRPDGPLAWVQIMTGCTNFCSYCIVPYVRGPESSRPAGDVVEEVQALTGRGVREVTLLGQNVNAYGREPGFAGSEDFADLLESLADVPGLARIRFMTSHPKDVSPRLIRALAELEPVCEHLHLPVQSGNDRILEAMRRGYDRDGYLRLADRLREAVPDLVLTTDVIVGFPSETEEEFEDTLSLVRQVGFEGAFTFVYSARSQTAAAGLPGRPAPGIAEERMARLVALVQTMARGANENLVGRAVEVLVEGPSRHDPHEVMGRTRTYKAVNFPGDFRPGDLVDVQVQAASSASLRGLPVARPPRSP